MPPNPQDSRQLLRQKTAERPVRSGRDFCARYFPRAHAAKECRCYPPQQGRLYILPRPGVNR